jgi:cysteine desulfurase / selenocysteine lyase
MKMETTKSVAEETKRHPSYAILALPCPSIQPPFAGNFPFCRHAEEQPIVYLDTAATAQKPACVIDALALRCARRPAACIAACIHFSERATDLYESRAGRGGAVHRCKPTRDCLHQRTQRKPSTSSRTAGPASTLKKGDIVVLTLLEHHSNIVPWLQLGGERHYRCDGSTSMMRDGCGWIRWKMRCPMHGPSFAASRARATCWVSVPIWNRSCRWPSAWRPHLIDAAQMIVHTPVDVRALTATSSSSPAISSTDRTASACSMQKKMPCCRRCPRSSAAAR